MDLIDVFRAFHPKAAEYTLFSSIYGMFSGIVHMLGHKRSLNKFKTEIISNIFSDHNGMKLEINHKEKKTEKHKETCSTKCMLLNNEWIINKIKEEIRSWHHCLVSLRDSDNL